MRFRKKFFNRPPGNPTEPGPGQDANKSLIETHSAAQDITDFLGEWDQETIISKDGTKFNVLAQREGSDTTFWAPTTDFKKSKVKIAKGSITAPFDDRTDTLTNEAGLPHKENYKHFQPPETTVDLLTTEDNYYFIKAIFAPKLTDISTDTTTNPPTSGSGSSNYHTHVVPLTYRITNFFIGNVTDFSIVRFDSEDATADGNGNEDIVSGSGATIYQYLGNYNFNGTGKLIDHAWRTGHTIDFRLPSYTMLKDETPDDP